jgi:DNA-directed RNA polymerase specialized sigma24 family protein
MATDGQLSERVRHGDLGALDVAIDRNYSIATFLVAALSVTTDATDPIERAWARLVGDLRAGRVTDHIRAEILAHIIDVLAEDDLLDTSDVQPPAAPAMLPADDRWAGWWEDEPPPWPEDAELGRENLLRAIRRLPLGWRALVVLRDVAGLTPAEAEPIVHRSTGQQNAVLDAARQGLLNVLDTTLGAHSARS